MVASRCFEVPPRCINLHEVSAHLLHSFEGNQVCSFHIYHLDRLMSNQVGIHMLAFDHP
ncbi:hypothetical protein NC653_011486 [Populus alba x Populus x berolinensis]|uniref:Uncharacterized protein n=1 Tax=Populus alba x Populus x berolinensis TaxID=444605 RepID=A0AAD6R287_9ROSI|nr:hypothetical protein NC653_011486 [Populus alba x Populus x berolinensis]